MKYVISHIRYSLGNGNSKTFHCDPFEYVTSDIESLRNWLANRLFRIYGKKVHDLRFTYYEED